jgi:hypothetical protein
MDASIANPKPIANVMMLPFYGPSLQGRQDVAVGKWKEKLTRFLEGNKDTRLYAVIFNNSSRPEPPMKIQDPAELLFYETFCADGIQAAFEEIGVDVNAKEKPEDESWIETFRQQLRARERRPLFTSVQRY